MKDFESQLTTFADKHIREIQYCVYGLGIFGCYKVFRSVRIFTRFEDPRQIPPEYFSAGVKLYGRVLSSKLSQRAPSNSDSCKILLQIEHIPIWSLRTPKKTTALDITVAGISGNSQVLKNVESFHQNKVWIRLFGLENQANQIYASVCLTRGWKFWKETDVAKILLSLSSTEQNVTVSEYPRNVNLNKYFPEYYRKLLQYEAKHRLSRPTIITRLKTFVNKLLRRSK